MKNKQSKIIKSYIERAVIEISGGCNYSCEMCPQTNPGRHKGFFKKMPLNEFKEILKQCVDKGAKVINLEGSGEPTVLKDLPEYINLCKEYGVKSYIFSNGFNFSGQYMKDCLDAGLNRFRFSIIGYNREEYKKWMNRDAFFKVRQNAIDTLEYVKKNNLKNEITSYHLIGDINNIEKEVEQYKKNWIDYIGINAEIWKMHNWSGIYDNPTKRKGIKKTCGRPFAPEITIRAGGLDGKTGAVHPCCQVLGRDEEAVLGHFSENNFDEIWNGYEYKKLRKGHMNGDFPDYCKDCDFLIDDPEVLVYTNYDRSVHKIEGTDFSLDKYRKK